MSEVWGRTPLIPAIGRKRQADLEFEASLVYKLNFRRVRANKQSLGGRVDSERGHRTMEIRENGQDKSTAPRINKLKGFCTKVMMRVNSQPTEWEKNLC